MTIQQRSAGAVIFREEGNRRLYLLLHYPTGHWDFVKGKIELGEALRDTILRETAEETGIRDIEFIDGMSEEIHYDFMHEGSLIHKSVVFHLARTSTSTVHISSEHRAHTWETFEGAMEMLTYENARSVLVAARRALGD